MELQRYKKDAPNDRRANRGAQGIILLSVKSPNRDTVLNQFICVPITETNAAAFLNAIAEAALSADLIELRLDYLPDEDRAAVWKRLPEFAAETKLLLTFRPREQGGQRDLSLLD